MDGADFVFLSLISFKKPFFPEFEQLNSGCSLSAGVYGSSTVSRAIFMKTYLILNCLHSLKYMLEPQSGSVL